jgi:hypothetical protein
MHILILNHFILKLVTLIFTCRMYLSEPISLYFREIVALMAKSQSSSEADNRANKTKDHKTFWLLTLWIIGPCCDSSMKTYNNTFRVVSQMGTSGVKWRVAVWYTKSFIINEVWLLDSCYDRNNRVCVLHESQHGKTTFDWYTKEGNHYGQLQTDKWCIVTDHCMLWLYNEKHSAHFRSRSR